MDPERGDGTVVERMASFEREAAESMLFDGTAPSPVVERTRVLSLPANNAAVDVSEEETVVFLLNSFATSASVAGRRP